MSMSLSTSIYLHVRLFCLCISMTYIRILYQQPQCSKEEPRSHRSEVQEIQQSLQDGSPTSSASL